MKKFLFLILAGALVFATFGCKQATDSEPESVPDTWTEITDITGYEGTYKGAITVENSGVPLKMTTVVEYPVTEGDDTDCVRMDDITDYTAMVEAQAKETGTTSDEMWGVMTTGWGSDYGELSDSKPYTATQSEVYTKAAFNEQFSEKGEYNTSSMFINQSKTKVKVVMEEILDSWVKSEAETQNKTEAEIWDGYKKEQFVSDAYSYSENPYKKIITMILVKQ